MIPTPHIECKDKSEIAKTVLMPGDPLRAKFIADTFLTDVIKFNNVRGMNGYTGLYKGKRISVMGSGMGMPSIGIYSYELFKFYDVDNIIRIGSAGSYSERLEVYDCVLATKAFSESSFAKVACGYENNIISANLELNNMLEESAKKLNIPLKKAIIHSSDVFYRKGGTDYTYLRETYGVEAVEMESFALFTNAMITGKKAACLLTISDSFVSNVVTTSKERQTTFTNMMKIALELAE